MPIPQSQLKSWQQAIRNCLIKDRFYLERKRRGIVDRQKTNKPVDKMVTDLEQGIAKSQAAVAERQQRQLTIEYPEQLPVSEKREAIKDAIRENQVIILAGETGSGKTTQLPKMLLELGYGVNGLIGHTQPRRLAARSVATRIAEELQQPLGESVGYQVRFTEQISPCTRVKLMTDGVLLNEIHHDRYLNNYDALIIDEAHERSLNIDFILGVLKQILDKRKDLKVIVTSATIDPGKFSKHFKRAPIIEVSGRTYPVEVLYQDDEALENLELSERICLGVDELGQYNDGDILVFLSGEREIRDAEKVLKGRFPRIEVLPLFARLSQQDQNKIFHPKGGQRIILATNVAETSLTVPRIKNVIDSGTARISRYSYRNKIQRLPIEPISQASANQRKGRCGRLEDGICLRLYSESDFLERPEFTDPEILRTNLASVILQMKYLRLGDIEVFPFIEPPDSRSIRDGLILLQELGAIDQKDDITNIGKQMARLATDPRLARMLIEAQRLNCLDEVLIITSALSIQDIRERPVGFETKAQQSHSRFQHETSDFCDYLAMWKHLSEQQEALSGNQFRKSCKTEYLSYLRWREWRDLYQQLKQQTKALKMRCNDSAASHEAVHQALLSGLLSHIAMLSPDNDYQGARNIRFLVFPGSGQFKRKHPWIVAGEIVETSKLYGRIVAKIDPKWLLSIAQHLIKKSYLEPHWSKKRGQVIAKEIQSVYGMVISADTYVDYGQVEPVVARELFIREALIAQAIEFQGGQRGKKAKPKPKHVNQVLGAFLKHNKKLIDEITEVEDKTRRRDLMVDEAVLYDFYHQRLPKTITNTRALIKALQDDTELDKRLSLDKGFLLKQSIHHDVEQQFPTEYAIRGQSYPLHYRFEPGHQDDGVSIELPVSALNQFENRDFERLVPGMLEQKIIFLLRGLPKSLRKHFVPIPECAERCFEALRDHPGDLLEELSKILYDLHRVSVTGQDWQAINIEPHHRMNVIVVNNEGRELGRGRDLEVLKADLKGQVKRSVKALSDGYDRDNISSWDFDGEVEALSSAVTQEAGGHEVVSYPCLITEADGINLRLVDDKAIAERHSERGVRQLILKQCADKVRYLKKNLRRFDKVAFAFAHLTTRDVLFNDILEAAVRDALPQGKEGGVEPVATKAQFAKALNSSQGRLIACADKIADELLDLNAAKQRVTQRMAELKNSGNRNSMADIQAQLAALFFPGFVRATDGGRLAQYQRYCLALEKRLEKIELNPLKDELNLARIAPFLEKLTTLEQRQADYTLWPPEFWEYRWLLEELRISIFSQGVKCLVPVSEKKLSKFWQDKLAPF